MMHREEKSNRIHWLFILQNRPALEDYREATPTEKRRYWGDFR